MCIGGECANLTNVYNSAHACQAGAVDMITIMQRNKVENFVIVCEKKTQYIKLEIRQQNTIPTRLNVLNVPGATYI